jgi:hypothetical protein
MHETVIDGGAITTQEVCIIPEGTISAEAWYTVESVQQIVADNIVYANARIYDANGDLIGGSGFRRVGIDFNSLRLNNKTTNVTDEKCSQVQIYGKDAYVDDWKIEESNWLYTQLVSIYDGKIVGYIQYKNDRQSNNVSSFVIVGFENDARFIRDIQQAVDDIFNRFHFNKMHISAIPENPAAKIYDKYIDNIISL